MKKQVMWILAVVVIALIGLSVWYFQSGNMGYSNYGSSTTTTTTPTTSSTSSTTKTTASTSSTSSTTTTPVSTVKKFTVHESSFMFDVSQITVNKGDTVQVTVINDGGTHNVAFPDFNTRTTINGGGSQTITFVADKTGTFQYYCEVDGHKAMGMTGTLTVQ